MFSLKQFLALLTFIAIWVATISIGDPLVTGIVQLLVVLSYFWAGGLAWVSSGPRRVFFIGYAITGLYLHYTEQKQISQASFDLVYLAFEKFNLVETNMARPSDWLDEVGTSFEWLAAVVAGFFVMAIWKDTEQRFLKREPAHSSLGDAD